jgi:hypothetical protein
MKTQAQLTTFPINAPSTSGPERRDKSNPDPAIAGFLAAREQLRRREQELEAEIGEIRQLLGEDTYNPPKPTVVTPTRLPSATQATPAIAAPRRPNTGLTQAVMDLITKHGPMTKDQLVDRLTGQNFPFFGKPKSALDTVLYGKKFQRNGKIFVLAVTPANKIQLSPALP